MFKTFLVFLLLSSSTTIAQTTYYISNSGNDRNSGTSPNSPWKTLKSLSPGGTYLFKRNGVFNFSIPRAENWNSANKITIASYGDGNKPVIELFTRIIKKQWIKHTNKVWKIDLRNKNNFTGLLTYNSNIGFIKVDGIIYGNKVKTVEGLVNELDFFADDTYLYLYSSASPSTFNSVQFTSNGVGIQLSDNMDVRDIKVVGAGSHGIQGSNSSNVLLERIDISEIGGAYLPGFGDGTVRYGNGIEFWNGVTNCIVQNCTVTNVYDVAITIQGMGSNVHFSNVNFINNYLDRNEQSFEAWAREGAKGFTACSFRNNKCYNAGYGWSHAVRPDKNQAVHILTYTWDLTNTDLILENNIFYRAKSGLYYHNYEQPLPNYTSRSNKIYLDPFTPIRSLFPDPTIENTSGIEDSLGKEAGSVFQHTSSSELPVTLQSFKAERSGGDSVNISWQTQPGLSISRTEVERSNINETYTTIANLNALDKSLTGKSYSLIDHPSSDSTIYYRLKQFDEDGHYTYSNVIAVANSIPSGQRSNIYL